MHLHCFALFLSLIKFTDSSKCSIFEPECWKNVIPSNSSKVFTKNHLKHKRIVGGSLANYMDYPFFVQLITYPEGNLCGGSLINKNWILSAGHCFTPGKSKYMQVVFNDGGQGIQQCPKT